MAISIISSDSSTTYRQNVRLIPKWRPFKNSAVFETDLLWIQNCKLIDETLKWCIIHAIILKLNGQSPCQVTFYVSYIRHWCSKPTFWTVAYLQVIIYLLNESAKSNQNLSKNGAWHDCLRQRRSKSKIINQCHRVSLCDSFEMAVSPSIFKHESQTKNDILANLWMIQIIQQLSWLFCFKDRYFFSKYGLFVFIQ